MALKIVFIRDLVSQPSVETGKVGGFGLGWPKAIQRVIPREENNPVIAPVWLADSINIPRVKMPSNGPPTAPKIVKLACREQKWL